MNRKGRQRSGRMESVRAGLAAVAVLLAGCGGGSGSNGETTPNSTVTGAIVKGPVSGAHVCLFELIPSGKGNPLGCTTTRPDGGYTIDVAYAGPVVVEASGGTYTDEATGNPGFYLVTALHSVGSAGAGTELLVATPLTNIAFERARAGGNLTLSSFGTAEQQVAANLGLPGDVDLARTQPNVAAGSMNAYGEVLAGVSRMMQRGIPLPAITEAQDLDALTAAYQACKADPPPVAVEIGIDLRPDVSADGPPAIIDVFAPDAAWRSILPATGSINQGPCQVTLNTEAQVRLSCAPTAAVTGTTVLAGGSAAGRSYEAQPNSYEMPLVAGDKVVFSGGALRVTDSASLFFNAGTGAYKFATGRVITISAGTLALNGGDTDGCHLPIPEESFGRLGFGGGGIIAVGGTAGAGYSFGGISGSSGAITIPTQPTLSSWSMNSGGSVTLSSVGSGSSE